MEMVPRHDIAKIYIVECGVNHHGSLFKFVVDNPHPPFKMAAVTKLEISFIVYCSCIISKNVTAATCNMYMELSSRKV